ncbi:hypothetical protein ACLBYG_25225 [Methylobacterium sp. D53M]
MPRDQILPDAEWAAAFRALCGVQAAYDPRDRIPMLVRILVETYVLILGATSSLRQVFQDIDEADFVAIAQVFRRALENDDLAWTPVPRDPAEAMVWAAARARAADALLHEEREHGLPADPNVEWLSADGGHFVIPRRRQRANKRALANQAFRRRAVLYHRILPTMSGGYRVRLHVPDAVTDEVTAASMVFGAAMFRDLDLTYDERPIVVREVRCLDAGDTVLRQLAEARRSGCHALVWAELCVPPTLLAHIQAGMAACPLAEMGDLRLVVAGSWHEEDASGTGNVMAVLDGFGEIVLRYRKILRYRQVDGDREGIEPGDELPVLVLDDCLVGFAICRDFCERDEPATVADLDVDLVIVPSLGDGKTLDGHRHTAGDMATRFNTRAFVVQQEYPLSAGRLGWVLDGAGAVSEQSNEFAVHPPRR